MGLYAACGWGGKVRRAGREGRGEGRGLCCTRFTPVMWVGRSVRRLTIPSLRGLSAGAPRVGGCGIARHACGPRLCGALEAEFRVYSSLQQQLTEPIGGESHRVPHRVAARVEESRGRGVAQRIALASRLGGGGERVALTGRLIRENTCDETGSQA